MMTGDAIDGMAVGHMIPFSQHMIPFSQQHRALAASSNTLPASGQQHWALAASSNTLPASGHTAIHGTVETYGTPTLCSACSHTHVAIHTSVHRAADEQLPVRGSPLTHAPPQREQPPPRVVAAAPSRPHPRHAHTAMHEHCIIGRTPAAAAALSATVLHLKCQNTTGELQCDLSQC